MPKTSLNDLTAASEVKPKAPPERFILHNAGEALLPQPPVEWLVKNLITAGSVNIFVGESGSKKTYALIDMALCVALGKEWLGYQTQQGAVLIIDEENGNRRLTRRIGAVLRGHLVDRDNIQPPVYWTSLSLLNLGSPDDINQLHILIERTNAKFVIIDSLMDVMPDRDENSVKDTLAIISALRSLSELLDVTFVVIHHLNKIGKTRGSTAISGGVDLIVQVESKPTSPLIKFNTEKARDIDGIEFFANANFGPKDGDGQFWLTERDAPQTPVSFDAGQRHILRYLLKNGKSQKQDILEAAETTTAKNAFSPLTEKGFIKRANEGAKGVPAEYVLTKEGTKQAKNL